jgi:hypothetical protein
VIAAAAVLGGQFPPEIVSIAQSFFATVAIVALGVPIIRAITRRLEQPKASKDLVADTTARLERIEQAVDAVAIEVERIAEAQRFSAKLMAEQQKRALPNASTDR